MTFRQLLAPALVVPATGAYLQVFALAPLSVVKVEGVAVSPLSIPNEVRVRCLDLSGDEIEGYLASDVTFADQARKLRALTREPHDGSDLRPLDSLRMRMLSDKSMRWSSSVKPWSPLVWFARFGLDQDTVALYPRIIRELGGVKPPRTTTPEALMLRALHFILQREVTMSEVADSTTVSAPASKSARKSTSKKTPAKKVTAKKGATKSDKPVKRAVVKNADAPARSMSRTVGNTLLPLFEKAHAKRDLVSLAKKLAGDEKLGKRQFIELRDGVNELATACRESKKESLASSLSGANKLVRRLARQA